MADIPRWLIIAGVVLVAIGLIWQFGGRFLPLGRLPGDILFKSGGTTVYIPLMTGLLISIVLSLIFFVIGRFR
ncbi:DUF2905 domain-containing protein [Natribacillus halophilus]|uniref:DUF2905 domain-containing protein n=1 Tax=Natribacillus halophilus TaxID=549003 RepID=A0A1G8NY08_9BACI|nr:DUF2905 domain-containing protein [Natribacillus halophilus]SDI85132.1 Protein of unknown function [Natribacillus halophilus]